MGTHFSGTIFSPMLYGFSISAINLWISVASEILTLPSPFMSPLILRLSLFSESNSASSRWISVTSSTLIAMSLLLSPLRYATSKSFESHVLRLTHQSFN